MSSATLNSSLNAGPFNGSDSPLFNPLGIGWPARVRASKSNALDKRRIAAIALTVCAHVLIFGSMLLPPKPIAPALQPPTEIELPIWEPDVKKPPQPTKPEITLEIKPRSQISAPVRSAPPVASQVSETTIAEPTEEIGAPIEAPVLTPPVLAPTPVSESLALVSAPPPRYPPAELKRGIEGTVHFKVRVGVDGLVKDIEIIKSSGSRSLDRAAIAQIKRRWVFEPRLVDGVKVESTGIGKLSFSIQ
jgi:periplasmic protein TonB